MIHQHLNSIEQGMLAAHRGNRLLAPVIGTKIRGVTTHDCISKFRRPSHRRVFAEVRLDSGDGGILDVLRRRKMGLAGAEVNYVNALLTQFVGLGDDSHSRGGFDAVDSISKSHG